MEQHGPVLPLETDSLIARHCCEGIHKRLPDTYIFPTINYTTTQPNIDFAGTVSVNYDIFRAYLRQVLEGILHSEFRAVVIVNGHGSVVGALKEVAFALVNEQYRAGAESVTPVLVTNAFDCDHLVEKEFGQAPGRHADWKETLLVYGILGVEYFHEKRMARLRSFCEEGGFYHGIPPILGVPMEQRSKEGVVGLAWPPGDDFQEQAERLWALTFDFLVEKIKSVLGGG